MKVSMKVLLLTNESNAQTTNILLNDKTNYALKKLILRQLSDEQYLTRNIIDTYVGFSSRFLR